MVENDSFAANIATTDLFYKVPISLPDDEQFQEGQKLEAVDPLEMSRICPATVIKVEFREKPFEKTQFFG